MSHNSPNDIYLTTESITMLDRLLGMQCAADLMRGLGLGSPHKKRDLAIAIATAFCNGVAFERATTPEQREAMAADYSEEIQQMFPRNTPEA